MRAPPLVPYHLLSRFCGVIGGFYSTYKVLQLVVTGFRQPGGAHAVQQMGNLEHKLNIIRKRTEATIKHNITTAAMNADLHLLQDEYRQAALALVQGLSLLI